ncbi:MAG: outer membrane beta-barrel protein [Candidatus Aminicenantes bacterium]|nr:outer membrane beta-barrel protein [Candidatus Aminicenantes bacterium]
MKKAIFPLVFCFLVFSLYPPFGFSDETKLEVKVSRANVRLKPDLNASVIGSAEQGTVLISTERIGDWFKVDLPPDASGFVVTGYIHLSTVNILAEKPEPVAPPAKKTTPPTPPADIPEYEEGAPRSGMSFGFRLLGGLNYASGGNISDGHSGLMQGWRAFAMLFGYADNGTNIGAMHMGLGLEADFILNFTKNLGVGIGAGYITAGGKSDAELSDGTDTLDLSQKSTASAIPIRLSLCLNFPVSPMMSFIADVGGGFYLTKVVSTFRMESLPNYTQQKVDTSASGIGFHGGLGLKVNFSPNLGLVLMGRGRYAKIKGFEGDMTTTGDPPPSATPVSGVLYYEEITLPEGTVGLVGLETTLPTGTEEAVFDFSGFGLIVGIMIGF